MPFDILHFRGSDQILRDKRLEQDFLATMQYLDDVLYGSLYRRELLREALADMGWRDHGSLNFLEGRRYQFKGYRQGIAMEANLNFYEFILEGLFRLQVAYDKGLIEAGILLLTAKRSDKSPYGSSLRLVKEDLELLYPSISLPVSVVLFDLGQPFLMTEEMTRPPSPDLANEGGESCRP
ncbi:MAG: hypothetical protein FJ126_12865 [Deltaproteobacteria bacterium]|nr:hypothetical protein [Deltaproteobacteria bacterium]